MTKPEKDMLRFLAKYPGKWHTFASDKQTVEIACALHNRGDCRVNEYHQMHSTRQGIQNAANI